MRIIFLATSVVVLLTIEHSSYVDAVYDCPAVNYWSGGICVEECRSSADCYQNQMCCSTGCGHICTKPVCRKPSCDMYCEYGWKTGRDGCPVCDCATRDVCLGVDCPVGQSCQAIPLRCHSYACDPSPVCKICQEPDCRMCPHGWIRKRDLHGCQTCECHDPCKGHQCPVGERCVLSRQQCIGQKICDPEGFCEPSPAKCPAVQNLIDICSQQCATDANCVGRMMKCCPTTTCGSQCVTPECPMVKCMPCPAGSVYKMDVFGCNTCECYNPCHDKGHFCPRDHYCVSKEVQCIREPCYPVATCKACPYCDECKNGFIHRKAENGCRKCECYDPCATVRCGHNQHCVVRYPYCDKEPCYPHTKCEANKWTPFSSAVTLNGSIFLLPIAIILCTIL